MMVRPPRRKWLWFVSLATTTVVASAVAGLTWWHPLRLPGSHPVAVLALHDQLSGPVPKGQRRGPVARLLGLCDADTHFVRSDGQGLCIVMSGPLGTIEARRNAGRIVIGAADVEKLREMAVIDIGAPEPTRTLVLRSGSHPVAFVPVDALSVDGELTVAQLG